MKHRSAFFLFAILAVGLGLTACDKPKSSSPSTTATPGTDGPFKVLTTFYPTTYLAQRIAGEHADVVCPLPADADPIYWKPDDASILAYQHAGLIIVNGTGFEKWIETVSLPAAKMVDTSASLLDRAIHYEGVTTHSHGDGVEHSHEGLDGHTWLSPSYMRVQSDAIYEALSKALPDHAEAFAENFKALDADITALDTSLGELSKVLGDQPFFASHPAYNYIARDYKWNVTNLDLDPELVPDADSIPPADTKAKIMLWESQPTDEVQKAIPHLEHIVFSPCEGTPESGDLMSVMSENVARFTQALAESRE